MIKSEQVLENVKEISNFLIETQDEYNQELALCLMQILENEHTKNYINFNEAFILISELGNWGLAKKCIDIAEMEILLEDGVMFEKNHYAHMVGAVELMKNKVFQNSAKPSLKNKYLYVLEFTNGTVKIGITKEKEKRMRAISSASGMNITRSYFTDKIDNVQNLETKMHRQFKDKRLNGEFFDIDFDFAVNEVKKKTAKTELKRVTEM